MITNPDASNGTLVDGFGVGTTPASSATAQSSSTGGSALLSSSNSTNEDTENEEAATLIDPAFFADDSLTDDPVIDDLADGLNDESIAGDDGSLDAAFADFNDSLLTDELVDLLV